MNVACFSGGKDSTAMILAMVERGDTPDGLLVTPTGNELPEVWEHWERIAEMVGVPTIQPKGPTLVQLIRAQQALPNFRMRWCTRMIKIAPAIAWAATHPDAVLCVGLRADEEERAGIISTSVTTRFPLQEFSMGLREVRECLTSYGIEVPERTDCALCYHQRIDEWWWLWKHHPKEWALGEELELETGHTFRSPGRDSWPLALTELRARFEEGHVPRTAQARVARHRFAKEQGTPLRATVCLPLFTSTEDDENDEQQVCRVCRL